MKSYVLILCVSVCLPVCCSGTVIHVPGDQPTIQAGIDAAVDGDTVLVADGTYTGDGNRDIEIHHKGITLVSENGPAGCIIDCDGSSSDNHRGFSFNSMNENDKDSILQGFTIINGFMTWASGGILCNSAATIILDCVISNNFGTDGGGINFTGKSPILQNCLIVNNIATSAGGGIFCQHASPAISNCTITGNSCPSHGGGVYCRMDSSIEIINSILWENSSVNGNEIAMASHSSVNIDHCDVKGGSPDVWMEADCTLIWGDGNINSDPSFVSSIGGNCYLSQIDAGQQITSLCVDSGNDLSTNLGLDDYTTRTDQGFDNNIVDLGFHYHYYVSTPTPVPTVNCEITMPADEYYLGDWFECKVAIINPSSNKTYVDFPTFVVLDVYGLYFFAPSFNSELDYYEFDIPPGTTEIQVIPGFYWPWGAGSGSATWIAGVVTPDFSQLFGAYDTFEFGWSE